MHDDVHVVAHYRIGKDIGGEAGGDQCDSRLYPLFAMFERLPGVSVYAAQECAPHAALDAVEGACGIRLDEL
jgi:hypothetical protein